MTRKRVTMKDIADRLNLSINAVSLALNDKTGVGEETKRLILNTAEEMGYLDQSVKYMQNYSNKNICVLLKNRFFRDFRFYGRVLLGIEEEAKKAGYDVFFSSFETEDIPTCVESRKVAGIIAVGKIGDSFLQRLKEYGVPIVLADYNSLEETVDCLMSDNKLGSYKMASYLYKKGFRKIGYVGDLSYSPSTRERFYGYQEAIQNCFGCSIGIRASKRKAIRMKYGVSKNTLLITAGIIWLTAGINILRIGVECWINDSHYWLFKACEATLVFLLFFGFIFRKLYRKHTHRISQKKKKNCPFSFFDVQGWIVMAFMITIGILSRLFHLLPESFIAVFYTGLSLALIGTGIRFIIYWWKNKHWLQ